MSRVAHSAWKFGFLLGLGLGLGAQTPLGNLVSEQSRTAFTTMGAGARAMGLGGAFIGVADDATAVSFNPSGLAQLLKPEVCFVGRGLNRQLSYSDFRSVSGPKDSDISDSLIGNSRFDPLLVAGTLPLRVGGRTLALQLSAQRAFSLALGDSRVLKEQPLNPTQGFPIRLDQRIDQAGQIDVYSAAVAYECSQRILVGLAVNRWKGRWTLESRSTRQDNLGSGYLALKQDNELSGQSYNLGLLWRWPSWSLGLVHRTAFGAEYTFGTNIASNLNLGGVKSSPMMTVGLHWPASSGIGLSVRPADRWLLALDFRHTRWSEAAFQSPTRSLNGLNFFDLDRSGRAPNSTTAHLGAEYLWVNARGWVIPLRGGLNREPQPVVDAKTGEQRVKYGASLGTGLKRGPYTLDLSYRYAWAKRQASQFLDPAQVITGSAATYIGTERTTEQRVDLSLIVQFERQPIEKLLRFLFLGD